MVGVHEIRVVLEPAGKLVWYKGLCHNEYKITDVNYNCKNNCGVTVSVMIIKN